MVYKILRFPIQLIMTLFYVVSIPVIAAMSIVMNNDFDGFLRDFRYFSDMMIGNVWE